MLPNSAIPHLYGSSLLGTSLRVYRGDKVTGTITPHFVGRPHADRIFPPDFLGGAVGFGHLVSGWIEEDAGNRYVYQGGSHQCYGAVR